MNISQSLRRLLAKPERSYANQRLVTDPQRIADAERNGFVAMRISLGPIPPEGQRSREDCRDAGRKLRQFLCNCGEDALVDMTESDWRAGEYRILISPAHPFLKSEQYTGAAPCPNT